MLIKSVTEEPRLVEDFDINYVNGSAISITIDPTTGDSYDFPSGSMVVHFRLGAKQSPVIPEGIIQPEEFFIPLINVLCIRHSSRMIEVETPEEKEEWNRVIQELTVSNVKH